MLVEPMLEAVALRTTLLTAYDVEARVVTFLPVGHDPQAAAFRVEKADGTPLFLKVRFGPLHEPTLSVPRALLDARIARVVAPLRTSSGRLWVPLPGDDDVCAVLYPFIKGESASVTGLTDQQWREFGGTLKAVHGSGLEGQFRDTLRQEDFSLASAAVVRDLLALIPISTFSSPAARQLAAYYREQSPRMLEVIERAETLGRQLRQTSAPQVLCHADIHLANLMVGRDGRLWMVDWDGPLLAPPERDLMFIVGSRMIRPVSAQQEDRFFAGYGPTTIDPVALTYFRYERILEDLGAFGQSVLLNPALSERARAAEAQMAMHFFEPDGDIDRAEQVHRCRWPQTAS